MERASEQLRALLVELADDIEPFPEFPGSFFTYGIEVEPPAGAGAERGCVVLAEDGELYELQVGLDPEELASGDASAMRQELRVPLEGLTPTEYVAYAYNAVRAAAEYVEAKAEASR
ncbi:MAG: hypothetical protein IIC87_07835 [Chloroflexi bacterium]|nr:hypothetical protein [Chloroflexota bacterium]